MCIAEFTNYNLNLPIYYSSITQLTTGVMPNATINNKWFSQTRFYPNTSRNFGKFTEFPDICQKFKFPDISMFSKQVVTLSNK